MAAGQLHQVAGRAFGDVDQDVLGNHRGAGPVRRDDQRRLLGPGQFGPPRLAGRVLVLAAQPGQVVAVRGGRRQRAAVAAVRVCRGEFGEHDRHRPAVHQDVVAGDDHPVAALAEADQQDTQQRRGGEVEAAGPLGRGQPLRLGLRVVGREVREVGLLPRQFHLAGDDLHRAGPADPAEAGAQRRVPGDQGLPRRAQPARVQGAVDGVRGLHRVDVRSLLVEGGVEEQPLLQW